jgi:hypothetical protein
MELFTYVLSQSVHFCYTEKLLIFVSWFCILLLCWSCLWCLGVSWWSFLDLLSIRPCHLWLGIDWLLVYLFVFFLSLLPTLLLWLGILRLCWIRVERVGTLVSYLTFSFSPLSMTFAIGLSYIAFIMSRYIPSIPSVIRALVLKWCWILSKALSASIYDQVVFVFVSINVLNYI